MIAIAKRILGNGVSTDKGYRSLLLLDHGRVDSSSKFSSTLS
jgi:hypothetical protein